jgi:hypothetical protein
MGRDRTFSAAVRISESASANKVCVWVSLYVFRGAGMRQGLSLTRDSGQANEFSQVIRPEGVGILDIAFSGSLSSVIDQQIITAII